MLVPHQVSAQQMSLCTIILRVKAHSGHPWSELADSLAKATAISECKSALPVPLIDSIVDNPYSGWASIVNQYIDNLSYPPVVDGAFPMSAAEISSQRNVVDHEELCHLANHERSSAATKR